MEEINKLVAMSGYSLQKMRKRGCHSLERDMVVRLLCLHLYNNGWEIEEIGVFLSRKHQSISRCIHTARIEVMTGNVSALHIVDQLGLVTEKASSLVEMSFICKCGCEFKRKITPPRCRSIWVKCSDRNCHEMIRVGV